MMSDVLGLFLTYLPTLIRCRQMWLDLPQDLTSDFKYFTSLIDVRMYGLYFHRL